MYLYWFIFNKALKVIKIRKIRKICCIQSLYKFNIWMDELRFELGINFRRNQTIEDLFIYSKEFKDISFLFFILFKNISSCMF